MKTMTRFISMAAAALAGAIITACSGSDDTIADTPQQPENQNRVITLTTTVGLAAGDGTEAGADGTATTRALTIDGAKGVKTFAAGETMALVYTNMSGETVVVPSEALKDGDIETTGDPDTNKKSATFTFNLTEAPNKEQSVSYIYPAAMATADGSENYDALYSQQDGTLATLASSFDLATFSGAWSGGNLPSDAELENQLAILAITLKNNATSGDITSTITGLTINDGTDTYTVNRSAAAGPIYVAVKPQNSTNFYVSANGVTNAYTKTLAGRQYAAGNGYNVSWRMTENPYALPLTLEALTDGTIVVDKPRSGMKYSVNGGAKTAVTSDAIDVSKGDKVQFYGNGTQYGSSNPSNSTTIAGGSATVKVYGNIMSLVNETGFATATTLTAQHTFDELFLNNTALTDASGLLLPATELAESCYSGMFYGCSSLTAAPALPATTLAQSCYAAMFWECTNLKTAPALPATTLAPDCYGSMFWKCTSLTAAPAELPATTLAENCYSSMFLGCRSLETAPVLPATTLAPSCYMGMFSGCTKLNAVTCLATDIRAEMCTDGWLDDVAPSGTFTKNPLMTDWPRNNSDEDEDEYINYGIPSGWTVQNYVAPSN